MKTAIYAVIIIVMFGSCFVAINANNNAVALRRTLEQERYARISAEENLDKANRAIRALNAQLSETQVKINNIQTIIDQGQYKNEDLKTQLNDMTQLKSTLEKKIDDLVQRINELEAAKR